MPPEAPEEALTLASFLGLLTLLAEEGLEAVVIGGCAVGAYARTLGETVVSQDLDLYADAATSRQIVSLASARGARLGAKPRPRAVQVAVFEWEGKEVNVLTSSPGLPPPETEARVAREFELHQLPGFAVLLADPFDLLANKLAVDRPKDRPHAEILRRFLAEEIVFAFREASDQRQRIGPARQWLRTTRARWLDEPLGERLIPLARTAADFRFLTQRLATQAQVEALLARAPTPDLAAELRALGAKGRLR
jgi:hypothetical protein